MMVAHPYSSATIAAGKSENEETLKSTEAPKPGESLDEGRDSDDDIVPAMTTANTIYRIEPDAKIPWNRDGKEGPSDPNNSEAILLNWLMKPGNYALYRNVNGRQKKTRNVLTKRKLVAHIAELINTAQVRKKRTGQQVQNKLYSIENGFRVAHSHATNLQVRSKTETVDIERVRQKVLSYCRWYFDLLEVFQGQDTFASMTAFLQVPRTADDGGGGGGGVNDENARQQENSEEPATIVKKSHVLLSRKNDPTTTGSSVSVGDHEATVATTKPPPEAKKVGGRKRAVSAGSLYGRRTKRNIQTGRKVRACRRLPPREIETLQRGEVLEEEEDEGSVDAISQEEKLVGKDQNEAKPVVLSGETSGEETQHHDNNHSDMHYRMKLVQLYGQLKREHQWMTQKQIVKMFPEFEPFIAILSGESEL